MTVLLKKPPAGAVPIRVVDPTTFESAMAQASPAVRRWCKTVGFQGRAHSHVLIAAADGTLEAVWVGVESADDPYALASLPAALPMGRYRIDGDAGPIEAAAAAHSWSLGTYAFERYKSTKRKWPSLYLAPSAQATRGLQWADAVIRTRDLVNTPAEHMGPADLAAAVQTVAKAHGAKVRSVVGAALLKQGFPAIHAVGRAAAADRAPRLIELSWGSSKHPRLTLVGKGVCFDTGGLDIKTSTGMRAMKKDMGGAANALGLAQLVMARKLPVQLQLLIPAVENSISGNAYRPGDVIRTRKGVQIEIGNTDAEGRVVLSDALAYGAESKPDLMIDMATLTGAARVALGPELPALFCRQTGLARDLVDRGLRLADPVWHMPLWKGYHANIESDVADIVNTGKDTMAGAITAALFLEDFVPPALDWLHIDLFAWNSRSRPGRPVGGEAQTLRTLIDYLSERYGA